MNLDITASGWLWRAGAGLAVTAAAIFGCSSRGSDGEQEPVESVAQAAAILENGFTDSVFASGISNPTAMAFAPDGRLFVAQQTGQLRVVKNGVLLPTPFLTVSVDSQGERGLLGVTFDPSFNTNKFVYVYYTTTQGGVHNRISRFTANGDVAAANSELQLVNLPGLSGATNHNGGALHFGNDGKLYVAVGENANGALAQSMTTPFGKMLRFNSNGSAPSDNPFFNTTTGVNQAIWALGLRNPFTFDVRPSTGAILINDVGQNAWEEVNVGGAGRNYGWPNAEGNNNNNAAYTKPLFVYGRGNGTAGGCAITGGAFYEPTIQQFPSSNVGKYFFTDYCNGWVRKLDPATGTATVFATGLSSPVDLRVGPDGALYYLARGGNGVVGKISYPNSQPPTVSSQPTGVTVPVGASATFTVSAGGSAPLTYQWQRNTVNISNATSASYTLSNAQLSDNGAQFRAVVTNGFGSATSNPATLTVTTNTAPTASIMVPATGATYIGGTTLNFAGTGDDAEQGALPASSFTWRIDLHHEQHTHPAMPEVKGVKAGNWEVPNIGHTETNVWYRVHLTVTDAGGLTATTFVDVQPIIKQLTLATEPAGLLVTLDDQPFTAPLTENSVVGVQRVIGVTSPQTLAGKTYTFTGWSDLRSATHVVTTPNANTTYTATFAETVGFTAEYYDNMDLSGLIVTRSDPTIDNDWGTGSPAAGVAVDTFSARWTGTIVPQFSQNYTFYTVSDDGIRLWVNGNQIINNWTNHGTTENVATVALVAGQSYSIKLEYYENGGGAVAKLHWSSASLSRRPVTTGVSTTPTGPRELVITGATSGTYQSPNEPKRSFDNDPTTRYCNDGTVETASITYTLGASASISKIRMSMNNGTSRIYPLQISVGSTVVFTGNTSLGATWETSFPATAGSTVTVKMTALNSNGNAWFTMFETDIYGQ